MVILGILAAVALPKFIDLREKASFTALSGIGSAITSASSANLMAKKLNKASATTFNDAAVCSRAAIDPLLAGGVPAGYDIFGPNGSDDGADNCATSTTVLCTLKTPDAVYGASFVLYCAR